MSSFEVAGRTVRMPVVVRDALAASATFVVPADPVAGWLPERLALVRPAPGHALLLLTAIDYRDNDLGRYAELSVAVAVRERGSLRTGTFIHRLPVDDEFSRAAGLEIWGFPKTVEAFTVASEGDVLVCRWPGELTLTVRSGGRRRLGTRRQRSYAAADGSLRRTDFLMRGTAVGVRPGGARLELGAGPLAQELHAAGLPRTALLSMSIGRLQARFDAPEPLWT